MPKKLPIIPLPLGAKLIPQVSPRLEMLIGRICVNWAMLEAHLQDLLWFLLGVPIDDGRIVTANTDANRKVIWVSAFAKKHLSEAQFTDFKTRVLDPLAEVRTLRNFVCHGTWGVMLPQNVPACMSVKETALDPTEIVTETFPFERLERIVSDIIACKFALMRWGNDHAKTLGKPEPYPFEKVPELRRLAEQVRDLEVEEEY